MAETALGAAATTEKPADAPATDKTALGGATTDPAAAKVAADAAAAKPAADASTANTDAAKPGEGEKKPDDGKKEGAPEAYADFKVPEGVQVDKEALEAFKPLAKELGLSQEQAQKLVDLQASQVGKFEKAIQTQWEQTQKAWVAQARDDKEIGGTKFEANLAVAAKALDAFGTPALRQMLDATGVGDHVELLRFAHKVGQAISEEKLILGGNKTTPKAAADILYPSAQS